MDRDIHKLYTCLAKDIKYEYIQDLDCDLT